MCGIFGYYGGRNASTILLNGIKRLEYRGYDSVGKISKNLLRTESSSFEEFKNSIKIGNIKMNILNLIKFENYYCSIDENFQKFLLNKVNNKKEVSNELKISLQTLERILNKKGYWMNFKTLLNMSKLLDISTKEVYKNVISIKTHNSFPILFNIKNLNSPAFFKIIGHILGDGGIHVIKDEGKYRAFYTNKEEELINSFEKEVTHLFGNARIYKRTKKTGLKEIWLPTTLGFLCYEFMEYKKNNMKRIPSFVYKIQDHKLLGSLLQALYDDEGFLYPQKRMIVISQKSKVLINDIREIVKKVGINPNPILIHKPKNRTKMYYFSITGKENILSFAKKIGFIHSIKKEKLKILTEKYQKK